MWDTVASQAAPPSTCPSAQVVANHGRVEGRSVLHPWQGGNDILGRLATLVVSVGHR